MVCHEYLNVDDRLKDVTKRIEEVFSKISRARASDISSSSTFPPQYEENSSVLETIISHTHGELPSYQPNSQTASETSPDVVASEIQQQPLRPNHKWPLKHVLP